MKKFLILLLCAFITLPVFAKNTILIVGDSLSAGYGLTTGQGWVDLLKQRLREKKYDYQVINISISGNTTSNGLSQLPEALKHSQPTITIIELGGNDGLRGISIETIKNNLQRMITLIKNAHSKVILLGIRLPPNYGVTYTQQFHDIYTELSQQNSIHLVPLFLLNIDENRKLMQPDQIHPTAEAQSIMLDNVWLVLKNDL